MINPIVVLELYTECPTDMWDAEIEADHCDTAQVVGGESPLDGAVTAIKVTIPDHRNKPVVMVMKLLELMDLSANAPIRSLIALGSATRVAESLGLETIQEHLDSLESEE